jgi:hypothetical protein
VEPNKPLDRVAGAKLFVALFDLVDLNLGVLCLCVKERAGGMSEGGTDGRTDGRNDEGGTDGECDGKMKEGGRDGGREGGR